MVVTMAHIRRLAFAGAIAFLGPPLALPQAAPSATASPVGPATNAFQPGLDDLMTMLIQPRHIKLYYAGKQGNWELAGSQARDLRQAFRRIAQYIPNYLGNDVNAALTSIIVPRLQEIDDAIAAAKPEQFTRAYDRLTDACNACHAYLEHPYHVIRRPPAGGESLYADQDFSPKPN